jgi:threonine dehydrogenase-like Zn-dependent dehydrogenase
MRALYWDGSTARVVDRPTPTAGPGTAVVSVLWAGVCNTDLELVKGYMGFRGILGHEFVGRVVEGPSSFCGKRVVGEINFGCGACAECQRGMARHCARRAVMGILDADGAFAERVAVPVENLHEVPEVSATRPPSSSSRWPPPSRSSNRSTSARVPSAPSSATASWACWWRRCSRAPARGC